MLLMIITVIGVLLLLAGLSSNLIFPAKYVKNSETCRLTPTVFPKVDPSSCQATDDGEPDSMYNPINPNTGAQYKIDIIGLSKVIRMWGLIVLIPCLAIYGYRRFKK